MKSNNGVESPDPPSCCHLPPYCHHLQSSINQHLTTCGGRMAEKNTEIKSLRDTSDYHTPNYHIFDKKLVGYKIISYLCNWQ